MNSHFPTTVLQITMYKLTVNAIIILSITCKKLTELYLFLVHQLPKASQAPSLGGPDELQQ